MADPVKTARKFLEGLNTRERKPWDEPMGGGSTMPMKHAMPMKPKPSIPMHDKDDIGSQVERITERNREFAKRTRHLRKDY